MNTSASSAWMPLAVSHVRAPKGGFLPNSGLCAVASAKRQPALPACARIASKDL